MLMFGDGALSFREFATREPHPLAVIHDAVLEFLRGRRDAVLCGVQAVNAYVNEARMTEDVDIVSTRPRELAGEIRIFLTDRFHIVLRVWEMKDGRGYRISQTRKPIGRHLVDVRPVSKLPPARRVKRVLVVTPPELIARKAAAMAGRRSKPKAMMDKADLFRLLLAFPELKSADGAVAECIRAANASEHVMVLWKALAAEDIQPEGEDDKFCWSASR
jgi:hypothetical protein